MRYTLRYYQDEAIESVFSYFKAGNQGHPLIELPTGTGKSLCIAGFTERALSRYPRTRIMHLTHSQQLVSQNSAKLLDIWPEAPAGIYHAGLKRRENDCPITFAGIDSVVNKPHIFGHQDLVMIDEAHMVDWKEETRYYKFLNGLQKINPKLRVIGLTATPWRQGVGHICEGGLFTTTTYSKIGVDDFHEFIMQGYLSPVVPLRTTTSINLENVGVVAGEFNQEELQVASDKEEIIRAAIEESLQMAADRNHWLVFCTGVSHVEHTTQLLNDYGVSAVAVHSKKPDGPLHSIDPSTNNGAINLYMRRQVRALVNMGVLTTGFDAPATDYIMMLRATMSAVLWVQMLGRGTRPSSGTGKINCLVGDFGGNTKRLGPINDPVIPRKKGASGGGEAPVKCCDHCGAYNHAAARICDNCKEPFPEPKTKLKANAASDELLKESESNPVVENFKVDYTSYTLHEKKNKPSMVKVTYTCGLRMFSEYLCFEHEGFAKKKAHQWWTKRTTEEAIPELSSQALQNIDWLPQATHIKVWVNKQYPEILNHCFDGTSFGTIEAYSDGSGLQTDTERQYVTVDDDDIPF